MEIETPKNYSFGTAKHEDVKTYSWTIKEMGLPYYMEVMRLSSHKTVYQFYIMATPDQFEKLRLLLRLKKIKEN